MIVVISDDRPSNDLTGMAYREWEVDEAKRLLAGMLDPVPDVLAMLRNCNAYAAGLARGELPAFTELDTELRKLRTAIWARTLFI